MDLKKHLVLIILLAGTALSISGQRFDFDQRALTDAGVLGQIMPAMARKVIAVYREPDRDKYLDDLFRLQLVAGDDAGAEATLASLRDLRRSPSGSVNNVRWEIYTNAIAQSNKVPFDEAFKTAFRQAMSSLDDKTAFQVLYSFGTSVNRLQSNLNKALGQQKGNVSIAMPDAIDLIRQYLSVKAFRSFQPLVDDLSDEDDRRRYVIDKDIPVRTPDGATVCALVIRPRTLQKAPTLLNFTIYADTYRTTQAARLTASRGYAAVEGLTRGKGCSPDRPVPIEHDGSDAAALIDWIAAQPWSDGRVGMYGGSYEGFTQWAAAKHLPKALKAIMPSVTFAPGIDFPDPGGIFQNYGFPWPFYTTDNKTLDYATYNDAERWDRINREWYVSGRAYRDLDKMAGTTNAIWERWLEHPTYDAYWQQAIPYGKEFARIKIPVLTTTGYYDDGQTGALYYFTEHYKYDPRAEHYLIIGPYDHVTGQWGTEPGPNGGPAPVLGYELDPASAIDILELRYQWFDYVFKGGQKPALLRDKVNYEVMGANVWKHAPSIDKMANGAMKFYLSRLSSSTYRLTQRMTGGAPITQIVDLTDRSDAGKTNFAPANTDNWNGNRSIVGTRLETSNGLAFVSEPFKTPTEFSGFFFGHLDLVTNKKDLDLNIQLYEQKPDGEYLQLSYNWARASLIKDRSRRQLLQPGSRQRLDFKSFLLTSRRFVSGSRLIVVISAIKRADAQINYGTGKDVSDETIADAKEPLSIKWFGDSFISLPVNVEIRR